MAKSFDDLVSALITSNSRSDRARRVDSQRQAKTVVSDPDEYAKDPAAVDFQDVDTRLTDDPLPQDSFDAVERDVLGKIMRDKDL